MDIGIFLFGFFWGIIFCEVCESLNKKFKRKKYNNI